MTRGRAASILAALLSLARPVYAQSGLPPGRVELSVGIGWLGGVSLGATDATETTGAGTPSRIFSTSSALAGAAGVDGRIAVRLRRRLEGEVRASYGAPALNVTIGNDIEASGTVIASETVKQFTIGGAALWYPPIGNGSPRVSPFLSAGLGYLRQLHGPGTLAVTGQTYDAGGGVKILLASRGPKRLKGLGVRADARIVARRKGVAFDDRTRFAPAVGASFFVRF
jgi:hypothetical protein